jgi:PPM family protein phosphatase
MNQRPQLHIATLSDTGRVRRHNEDALAAEADIGLLVLADGMGGYQAGEVASALAVKEIIHTIRSAWQNPSHEEAPLSSCRQASLLLKEAILRANQAIFTTAQEESDCYGMGTTLVTALFYGNYISIAHVGDSRLYRLRADEFTQLTTDHSVLQELIEQGFYTREEARYAPNKNLVTRALGVAGEVEVDIFESETAIDDVYLLCSDGLNDMLDDRSIRHILINRREDLDKAVEGLVQAANEAGGEDNISVILARLDQAQAQTTLPWWRRFWQKLCA